MQNKEYQIYIKDKRQKTKDKRQKTKYRNKQINK